MSSKKIKKIQIAQYRNKIHQLCEDVVVVEEPLEVRVVYGILDNRQRKQLYTTMRTPSDDIHLVLGFLFAEGIIQDRKDVIAIEQPQNAQRQPIENVIMVHFAPWVELPQERNFVVNSACGVCGKTSIAEIQESVDCEWRQTPVQFDEQILLQMSTKLYAEQDLFQQTGGIHAVALFSLEGELLEVHEDIGRHNAMDKLLGTLWYNDKLPIKDKILFLSGRASFELIQKAVRAGASVVASVGAPSSLAVELAQEFGIQLYGFVKQNRFNKYT